MNQITGLPKSMTRVSPKLCFAILLLFTLFSFSPITHATPSCDQLFIESRPRTELETLQVTQALVPHGQYRLSGSEVQKIATKLGLTLDETYFELARVAATRKSTPISNFGVGAAGVTTAGEVFLGANIEFKTASLGSTLHAERTVLLLANDAGAKLERLYSTVTPCGGCRQWLNEIEGGSNLKVISKSQDGVFFTRTLAELLPLDFGPGALGQKGLMDSSETNKSQLARVPVMINGLNRTEVKALVAATEVSYSPYTKSPAGALLRIKGGGFVTGSYIEAAAYESYSPIAVALAKMKMMGVGNDQIEAVYLLMSPPQDSRIVDHVAQAEILMTAMNDEKFDASQVPLRFRTLVLHPRE